MNAPAGRVPGAHAGGDTLAHAPKTTAASAAIGTAKAPAAPLAAPLPTPLLVTAFEPFGTDRANASLEALRLLEGVSVGGHPVITCVLPTVFGTAAPRLLAQVAQLSPLLVLGLGQAGGRAAVSIERIAINLADARIPDNAGAQPVDRPVVAGGPDACFSGLPVKAMLAALQAADIPAEISSSAGTFVCNHVFYALVHALRGRTDVRGGFVHLPWIPEQGTPSLLPSMTARAVLLMLQAALSHRTDIVLGAGTLN